MRRTALAPTEVNRQEEPIPSNRQLDKAARCGEPSYVWRAGQQRRLQMILEAAGERLPGMVLENGCGIGMYVERLAEYSGFIIGLEYDEERANLAASRLSNHTNAAVVCATGEYLPFNQENFDLILSHEVLEHVENDVQSASEMIRTLKPGGRAILFVPNKGYPFETHGIFWNGSYHFGNIPLVNYLPRFMRDRLAPHVRIYTREDLENLFRGLPIRFVIQTVIFGAYDNIIYRWPRVGRILRSILYTLEKTPLKNFGLSHFWVLEKNL